MTEKHIYTREDFPQDAEYMMSLVEDLRKEFLEYHENFTDSEIFMEKGKSVSEVTYTKEVEYLLNRPNTWKSTSMRYHWKDMILDADTSIADHFPTAMALTKHYDVDCPLSNYSVIDSNTIIHRHTGIENREGIFIRVHIPIIVPSGDLFFEVSGEVVRWDDIFAFNNQKVHSAWNCTDNRRVVYIIDISRKRLGLPQGTPYDAMRDEVTVSPFIYNGQFA